MKADFSHPLTLLRLDAEARPEAIPSGRVAMRMERLAVPPAFVPKAAPALADAEVRDMRAVFERTGGLLHEGDAALLAAAHVDAPTLRTLVDDQRIVCFVARGQRFVPLFQFAEAPGQPCAAVRLALAELADVFETQEVAAWFGRPNPWLGGLAPAEAAQGAPGAVLQAARVERFVRRW
jgi:hypothetical protein